MSAHEAGTRPVDDDVLGAGCWQATCVCGWFGTVRLSRYAAQGDACRHEELAW